MTWARLDDGFHAHPKVRRLSLAARGLFATCLSYAAHYETDGVLNKSTVADFARQAPGGGGRKALRELYDEGMLFDTERAGECAIHDYLDFNPSHAELEAERARNRDKARRHRARSKQQSLPWSNPVSNPRGTTGRAGEEPPTSGETAGSDAGVPARSWAEWVEREFPDLDDAQRQHAIRSGEFWGDPGDTLAEGRVRQQVQAWGAAA